MATTMATTTTSPTAASGTPPTPPPGSRPLPSFPLKSPKKYDPNPHPYAIKTTSTGVLSRANSSGHTNQKQQKHSYVPSPSPSFPRRSSMSGHRHSKSLTDDELSRALPTPPRPLPTPPPRSSSSLSNYSDAGPEENWTPPRRVKRAETLPSGPPPDLPASVSMPVTMDPDLPANPKLWTPSQVSAYLTSALRVRSGEQLALPQAVARDIVSFVRKARIGGHVFLRLNENDLEEMGVNKMWRTALLNASRNLRADVLKGRIWGFGSEEPPSPAESKSGFYAQGNASSTSSLNSVGFSSPERSSEMGLDEAERLERRRERRAGRVGRIVQHLERRGSESSVEDSPQERGRGGAPEQEQEQEPSIEELLEAEDEVEPDANSWGHRAWEMQGVTVKRLNGTQRRMNGTDTMVRTIMPREPSGSSSGSGSGSGGSGKGRLDQRRVVTAIFSPEAEADAVAPASPETGDTDARTMLDEFRRRLEVVEQRMERAEAREAELERALAVERARRAAVEEALRQSEAALAQVEAAHAEAEQQARELAAEKERERKAREGRMSRGRALVDRLRITDELPSIAQLPSYVLLVGFGVCVVALRVVFRRVAMSARGR